MTGFSGEQIELIPNPSEPELAPVVVSGMETLQESHFSGNVTQVHPYGYGGATHFSGGWIQFAPYLPETKHKPLLLDHWTRVGFTETEVGSGISVLQEYRTGQEGPEHLGFVAISGVLAPGGGSRILRTEHGNGFSASALTVPEATTMLRVAFLSQLAGYVADRYPDADAREAVTSFIAEVGAASDRLDDGLLKRMFYGFSPAGADQMNNVAPTLVSGQTRFDQLLQNYRQENSMARRTREHELVRSGVYLDRIARHAFPEE